MFKDKYKCPYCDRIFEWDTSKKMNVCPDCRRYMRFPGDKTLEAILFEEALMPQAPWTTERSTLGDDSYVMKDGEGHNFAVVFIESSPLFQDKRTQNKRIAKAFCGIPLAIDFLTRIKKNEVFTKEEITALLKLLNGGG